MVSLTRRQSNPHHRPRAGGPPATIIGIDKVNGCGNPAKEMICTSHIERLNLSIRMGNRRMTLLTNAHSKKRANHEAMLALYFAWYNFCRNHTTLKQTPGARRTSWSIIIGRLKNH